MTEKEFLFFSFSFFFWVERGGGWGEGAEPLSTSDLFVNGSPYVAVPTKNLSR